MGRERYVILGLAPARAGWFEAVAQWTMSASIAAEFVKCMSAEEVRARMASGRRHSALLIGAATPSFDRDLVDVCRDHSTPVIVVRDRSGRAFASDDLGVTATLDHTFGPGDLIEVLSQHCQAVVDGGIMPAALDDYGLSTLWQAPLFAVCGSGGTGASTVAMALASGLVRDPRFGGRVLLADLARRADQAMLHDSAELGPGVQEVVEAHRLTRPSPAETVRMTFHVPRRGYQLLLGLRQPEQWSALRPRSVDAAVTGLRQAFQVVVADLTGDFEGEADGGSMDVEERNHMTRTVSRQATLVLAVGAPGLKGIHTLAGLMRQMTRAGVAGERIVPVINRSPRHPRSRAESSRALADLTATGGTAPTLAAPLFLPERKVEDALRNGSTLPPALVEAVTRSVLAVADRLADSAPPDNQPARIPPGTLASWAEDAEFDA